MGLFRKGPIHQQYRMPKDKHPKCPKCEREIDGMMSRDVVAEYGKAMVWTCPHCLTVLGVTHRQGYILG